MIIKQDVKIEADNYGKTAKIIIESEDGKKVCFIEENVEGFVTITIYHPYHWGGLTGKAVE